MATKQNFYNEEVIVSKELDITFKKCLLNHLILYNHILEVLEKDPHITFRKLKKIIHEYITSKKIEEYLASSLYHEMHYLYKKYASNNRTFKQLSDIQYLTFYINDYNNKNFSLKENRIIFANFKGCIELKKDFPIIENKELVYLNLSYSTNEDKYKISIYK